MPNTVLLLGDSISNGYRQLVGELLAESDITVEWSFGGSSAQMLSGLGEWIDPRRSPDVVHFNCGLHDARYFTVARTYQQPLANYKALLSGIVEWLRTNTSAKLVWASTTPVNTERLKDYFKRNPTKVEYLRFTDDITAYNEAARAIMEAASIPINDLHAVIRSATNECHVDDGVHMAERGYELLARAVADTVRTHLR